jgi:gamma-glutamylcyclotransferase
MKYFSYGSNMLEQRLCAKNRVSDASCVGAASIHGYKLRFHKKSTDESGKCNMLFTGDQTDIVYGVVYDIPVAQLPNLDQAEGFGKGYHHEPLSVRLLDGTQICSMGYIADNGFIEDSLIPYDWYHNLVVAGAEQHVLPANYILALQAVRHVPDPKPERKNRREALEALEAYYATKNPKVSMKGGL